MSRAMIVNPWMPQYRRPFFEELRRCLREEGVDLDIAYGQPDAELARRADTEDLSGAVPLRQRDLRVGSRGISAWELPDLTDVDLLIVEQGIRHLSLYRALLSRPRGCALALWGHGRTYTKPVSKIEAWIKRQVTLRADWFFAYTDGGRRHICSYGFPHDRVTVVQNSQPMLVEPRTPALAGREEHAPTGLFIGGIDSSKRIELLLDAAVRIRQAVPDFRLVVAGRGAQEDLVRSAAQRHEWVEHVGFADNAAKAELARRATVLLMPGRVGLVVVDSMVFGLPLVTTTYPYHAPEIEYLLDTGTLTVTAETPEAFAHGVVDLMTAPARMARLSERLQDMAPTYTLEAMVTNFAAGVRDAIAAGRRS